MTSVPSWASWDGSPRFLVLACLYNRTAGLAPAAVARLTGLEDSMVDGSLRGLDGGGYVTFAASGHWKLTDAGAGLVRSAPITRTAVDYQGEVMVPWDPANPYKGPKKGSA